jgi:hypothetical protein
MTKTIFCNVKSCKKFQIHKPFKSVKMLAKGKSGWQCIVCRSVKWENISTDLNSKELQAATKFSAHTPRPPPRKEMENVKVTSSLKASKQRQLAAAKRELLLSQMSDEEVEDFIGKELNKAEQDAEDNLE